MAKSGGTERVNPDEPFEEPRSYMPRPNADDIMDRPKGESPPDRATGYQHDAMPMVEFEIRRIGDMFWINVDGVCWLRAKVAPRCDVRIDSDRALDRIEPY